MFLVAYQIIMLLRLLDPVSSHYLKNSSIMIML